MGNRMDITDYINGQPLSNIPPSMDQWRSMRASERIKYLFGNCQLSREVEQLEAKLEAMERLLLPVLWASRNLYATTPHSIVPSALQYAVWEQALMEVASFYPDTAAQQEQGE